METKHRETQKTLVSQKGIPAFLRFTLLTDSERETLRLAESWGRKLRAGDVVAVAGPLGSGKTVFIKGLARGLGVKDSRQVKSPTFVLLHFYEGRVPIQHFDLYRLEREEMLEEIGFDEFISNPGAVTVVEWADKARGRIPKTALWVELQVTGPHSRRIKIWGQVFI